MSEAKAKSTGIDTMNVKIYAPFKVYFEGPALSVSATNRLGPFDVLPHHHNFITLLQPGNVVVRPPQSADFKLPITKGIMHVRADTVKVFLDV